MPVRSVRAHFPTTHSRQHLLCQQSLARTSTVTFRNLIAAAAIAFLKAVGATDHCRPSLSLTGSCLCTRTILVDFRSATIPQVSKREVHTTFTSASTVATLCGHAASDSTLIDCATTRYVTKPRPNTLTACCSGFVAVAWGMLLVSRPTWVVSAEKKSSLLKKYCCCV